MVGTAVYHVASYRRASSQNADGRNLGSTTVPPVDSVASTVATRPCTWKSGMTHIVTSSPDSSYVRATAPVDATRLRWRMGTVFGLLVVPLVCSRRARESGPPAEARGS